MVEDAKGQTSHPGTGEIWRALQGVMDPEIPVVSLVELGVVRSVHAERGKALVEMTPTFSGCPALDVMQQQVRERLADLGFEEIDIAIKLNPPWTTDWLSDDVKAKLREFGLAPPRKHGGNVRLVLSEPTACPYCGSLDTELKNGFGSTLCRSIYVCHDCQQPFEAFKPL